MTSLSKPSGSFLAAFVRPRTPHRQPADLNAVFPVTRRLRFGDDLEPGFV
jgi:hypothetical protein